MELLIKPFNNKIIKQMKVHCVYDNRKDRENAKRLRLNLVA